MINVASNMDQKQKQCPLCFLEQDDQKHLLDCLVISLYDMSDDVSNITIADIFSADQSKIKKAGDILFQRFRIREVLLAEKS